MKLLCLEKLLLNVLKDCFETWLEIEISLLVVKKLFSQGLSTDSSCCTTSRKSRYSVKTLKDVASGMVFGFMREFGELGTPRGQRICKSFGVEQDEQAQCQKHENIELLECCSTFKIDHQ